MAFGWTLRKQIGYHAHNFNQKTLPVGEILSELVPFLFSLQFELHIIGTEFKRGLLAGLLIRLHIC